jgi:homoserine trans-succinylase
MPTGYFDSEVTGLLTNFQDVLVSDRREELMNGFPEAAVTGKLQRTWHSGATAIYRNWLRYMMLNKASVREFSPVAAVHQDVQRKRSALG